MRRLKGNLSQKALNRIKRNLKRHKKHYPEYKRNIWHNMLPLLRHILPAVLPFGVLSLAVTGLLWPTHCQAQVLDEIGIETTDIDTSQVQTLRADIDALAFFRDNEYNTNIQNGYSLPGVRLTPHLAYTPIRQINIEAGASMLFFNGANKYPCFVYHDIATWKGNQYQPGTHVVPWVRLQAAFKHIDIVLGNIYGTTNHQLLRPLYNSEQVISADPEMGVQLLVKTKHFDMDTWMNWQSYQFELDTHQEAFTVGLSSKTKWNICNAEFYTPIQLVIQHRGGEQDRTNMGVQTICNGAFGLALRKNYNTWFNGFDAQIAALGCYQQAGKLWPFDLGFSGYAGLKTSFWNHFNLVADYTYTPRQFVSLYGNPFYSSISIKHGGTVEREDGSIEGQYDYTYSKMHNLRIELDYHYTFAKHYTLGVDAELYAMNAAKQENTVNFSFGIYLHVNPTITIKKFKKQ